MDGEVKPMLNITELLGIEKLFVNATSVDALKQNIMDNVKYVIPAYGCDYYLRAFGHSVEFELCRGLDGVDRGIAVHFSGKQMLTLTFDNIISTVDTAHVFSMHGDSSGDSFPVRIVCPDVLAKPTPGDRIYGQIEAFMGDNICVIEEEKGKMGFIRGADDGNVRIAGFIRDVDVLRFHMDEVSVDYFELLVETDIGEVPVITQKEKISAPQIGQYLETDALLSFDVAIAPKQFTDEPFARDYYADAPFESEYRLGVGFIPGVKNAERILFSCIERGCFDRFRRGCAASVTIHSRQEDLVVSNGDIADTMTSLVPSVPEKCEMLQMLSCTHQSIRGWNAVVCSSNGINTHAVTVSVDKAGFIEEIWLLDPDTCELGYDEELHALAMLAYGMCGQKADLLREFISDKCYYHSEYADQTYIGGYHIIKHLNEVAENLNETNQYTYQIVPASEALRTREDLPEIYRGKWCDIEYQGEDLAYVVFIKQNEAGEISLIRLSRNGNYLNAFEKNGSSVPILGAAPVNVKELLERFYGHEDPIQAMRENETPDEDEVGVYVWKEADTYMRPWLRDQGYSLTETVAEDDSIGYACSRRGKEYAVYTYAYGKLPSVQIDAEYCQRLKTYPLSKGRMILIVYLRVESVTDENGNQKYQIGLYHDTTAEPKIWTLKEVNGHDIILYYPRPEIFDMNHRLMAAFNTQDLDILRGICTSDVYVSDLKGGRVLNSGFYSHLSYIFQQHGKMKTAYVRYNDVLYSLVPYLEGYCYFSFSVTNDTDKICRLVEKPLDGSFRELLITEEQPESDPLNEYPLLDKVEFLPPSDIAHFSVRLVFRNGEVRRYDFREDMSNDAQNEGEVDERLQENLVIIDGKCFTDKIFHHGFIADHVDMPEWIGYRRYPERGQGIVFFNGYGISTAELYFNSYPIEKFNYSRMGNVHVSQFDYYDDGFGVGRIYNLDPQNPLYLLDKNTYTAITLPEKYQNTQIGIVPFYGGYSEGRVMVSLLGDIDLQYHHNRRGCAGMWGWLDNKLSEVIPPQYIFAMNFEGGRAIVCKGEWAVNEKDKYWCEDERWGVIDLNGNEVIPCKFDELYEIGGTDRLYFIHEGGWDNGHYGIFDIVEQAVILELDFDFDMGYMFNECFVAEKDILVFDEHLPGEGKDLITAYDLHVKKYLLHQKENTDRTYNGEKTLTVKNEETGMDVIVF